MNSLDGQLAGILYQFKTLLEKIHPLTTDLENVDPKNDDYIGLTVSYNKRFYTKFVPGYDDFVDGKYRIYGDYSKDPQIYCKIDGYKAILLVDPKWMATTTSFVNMRAGNGRFAGLCTIKDIYHEDEVLLATPIIIGILNHQWMHFLDEPRPIAIDIKRNSCIVSSERDGTILSLQKPRTLLLTLDLYQRQSYTLPMNYQDYITLDPNKRGGKPCVRGLRITVYEVLDYLASDMSEEEILEDFPDLTRRTSSVYCVCGLSVSGVLLWCRLRREITV